MNANTEVYDKVIDRAAMLRLYEQRLADKVFLVLDGHKVSTAKLIADAKASPAGFRVLRDAIDNDITKTYKEVYSISKQSLLDMASNQISYMYQTFENTMGNIWRTARPTRRVAEEIVLERPLFKDQTLAMGWAGIAESEKRRIEALIRNGIADGKTTNQMALDVRKGNIHNISKNQSQALVITAVTSVHTQADGEVYKANRGAISGWEYVSVLDKRTTPICRHRDGQIYDIDDIVHKPPAHYRCRSTTVPVFKSWDDLSKLEGLAQIRRRNLDGLTPAQIAFYDGQTPLRETYDAWLRRQPKDVQIRHLGDYSKLNMFNSGELTLDKFDTLDGKSVGLNELRAMTDPTLPNDTRRFAQAKAKLDAMQLGASRPEDFINDQKLTNTLRDYYLLQAGELDGVLSLTNYRGTLLGTKRAAKRRVLTNLPREDQMIFNPVNNRYEDARIFQQSPQVLNNAVRRIEESDVLKDADKVFLKKFIDSLEMKMGANQRAVVADNLRILFTRQRNNPEVWSNFKAVSQSQIKFDVMNISDTLETQLRADSDVLKKLKINNYIDPVLGPTQLQDLHDNFIPNIVARNKWEDRIEPNVARSLRHFFDEHIPLKLLVRLKKNERDLQQFYLKFARRLAIMETPDFDQIAMELGRDLYNLANLNGNRRVWFDTGKKLLESGRVAGFYELETYGVQKRRMKSRMSGQYFGQYYDVMTYNIRVTDPRILKYTKLQRKVELGLRVSVKDDGNRLFFKPGRKTYFIKRGLIDYDTRIPITSTSSFAEFPDEFIDKEFTDALNWAGGSKYRIDPQFYDFMKSLLYFKDDKGKSDFFDDLNHYRKYIVERGDSYERFKAMEWLRGTGESFSNHPFIDHRARVYDRGLIGPQSGETFIFRPLRQQCRNGIA